MNSLEGSSLSEAQVCDDLSAFIQLFKRILGLMEAAAATLQRTGTCLALLERIRTALELIDPLLQRYTPPAPLPLHPTTLHRAVCRLLEMIALYRLKYQQGGSAGAGWLLGSLGEAESAIRKWGGEQQLGRMLQVLQLSFIKFCVNCERRQTLQDDQSPQYSQTYHSMKQKVKGYKQGQTVGKEREVEFISSSEDEPEEETVVSKAVARALGEVQRKFDLLRGLDLDYSCFKTNFFYAKKDPLQLEKDCLERNTLNARVIATYHDDFYLFQKRRESKAHRRNKRRQLVEPQKNRLDSRDIRIRRNKGNVGSVEERGREKERGGEREGEGKEEGWEEASKVSYKMKNVYLTLGKKTAVRARQDIASPSVLKKKTAMQAMTLNQSYYNELDYQTTNSIAFLHNKLKIPTDRHIRFKTETPQNQPIEDVPPNHPKNLLTEQSTPLAADKTATSGFASVLPQRKTKYLQVNCLPNRRESDSRSRIMLSINPNVKKPGKNKGDSSLLLAQLRP